jgi:hypothetical protein
VEMTQHSIPTCPYLEHSVFSSHPSRNAASLSTQHDTSTDPAVCDPNLSICNPIQNDDQAETQQPVRVSCI